MILACGLVIDTLDGLRGMASNIFSAAHRGDSGPLFFHKIIELTKALAIQGAQEASNLLHNAHCLTRYSTSGQIEQCLQRVSAMNLMYLISVILRPKSRFIS